MLRKLLFLFACIVTSVTAMSAVPDTSNYNITASERDNGKTIILSQSSNGQSKSIVDYISDNSAAFTANNYENIVFTGDLGNYDVVKAVNNADLTTVKHIDMGGVTSYNGSTKEFTSTNLESLVISTNTSSVTATNKSSKDFVILKSVTTYVNSIAVNEWQATAVVTTAGSLAESMSFFGNYSIDKLTVRGSLANQNDANALNAKKVDLSYVTSYIKPESNNVTKFIIMPASETELTEDDFTGMSAIQDVISIYKDADNVKCLATYSASSSTGKLENVLAMTSNWYTAEKVTMAGTYKDVLTYMYRASNYGKFLPTSLNLANAHFPSFKTTSDLLNENYKYDSQDDEGYCIYKAQTSFTIHNLTDASQTTLYVWKERLNGLLGINLVGKNLTSISLPTSTDTEVLPSNAMLNLTNVTELTVPSNIKSIGVYAFSNMSSMTSASIDGATVMGAYAFNSCSSMSLVNLPSTLKAIPPFCFTSCNSLKNVNLPEGIEDIEESAFAGNAGDNSIRIDAIRLPSTLKTIGYEAFKENHFLSTITFPENVTYIAKSAFGNCNALEDIYFMGTTTIPTVDADAFDATTLYNDGGVCNNYCNDKYVTRGYYSKNGSYASTSRDISDQGAAILHYPVVKQEAEYTASPITATQYNKAQSEPIVQLYTKNADDTYTVVSGIPSSTGNYFVQKNLSEKETTTSSIDGITTYYNEGGDVDLPIISGDYYVKCKKPNYSAVSISSESPLETSKALNEYYFYDYKSYTATKLHFWDSTNFYLKNSDDSYTQVFYWVKSDGTLYQKNKDNTYSEVTSLRWYNDIDCQKSYYYVSSYSDDACNENGNGYVAGQTYYTDNTLTTPATTVNFSSEHTYYYYPVEYTEYSGNINNMIIRMTTYYSEDSNGNKVQVEGTVADGTTLYTLTKAASDDLYGDKYTDVLRDAKYSLTLAEYDTETGTFTPVTGIGNYIWPTKEVFMAYANKDYGDDPQAGLKRFILIMGFDPTPTEISEGDKVPDIVIPNLQYDIWYTIYLPYNMTSAQVRSTFGASTQVCNFLGIKTETVNGKTVNTIDFSKDMITETTDENELRYGTYDDVIIANTPYMIKPSVVSQIDDQGKKIPVQFRANGVTYKAKASRGENGAFMPFGEYDCKNGGTQVTAEYLPGYQFVGTYGEDNDGETSVVMKDPCYYFGTKWKDAEKTELQSQAFYNYRGYATEGNRSLTWKPYTCVILPPSGQSGAKVDDIRFGVEYAEAENESAAIHNIEIDGTTVNTVKNQYIDKVYNMNGQYVGNSIEGLTRGMYIVNGKKFVVK